MKKILLFFITILCCLSITACSGSSGKINKALIGKYVCVSGTMFGITMSSYEMSDFEFELQSKGKATIKLRDDYHNIEWKSNDKTLTLKVNGLDVIGEVDQDTIMFKDFLQSKYSGVLADLTFAKEGSDAAKPENYMPEEEKAIIGDWSSVSVTDKDGYDVSTEVDPTALTATFADNYSATISFMGEELGESKWSMFPSTIFFEDEFKDGIKIGGDYYKDDGTLILIYSNESTDSYYIFTMIK